MAISLTFLCSFHVYTIMRDGVLVAMVKGSLEVERLIGPFFKGSHNTRKDGVTVIYYDTPEGLSYTIYEKKFEETITQSKA